MTIRAKAEQDRTIDVLRHIWLRFPDLRLMQLIGNSVQYDPYFMEDDSFENALKKWAKWRKSVRHE